jgi:peptidyl-tRNA hydrolase, PTH1 family
MSKYLIVGLGNIGEEYANTRHNIGFDVLDELVKKHHGSFKIERLADVAEIKIKGKSLFCIKPNTYMNLSGKAVKYWREKEHIPVDHILVIVDDLALPLEKLRIRGGGTHAGHNGLKSIQELLATPEYPKLRFGIGSSFPKGKQVDFVLGKWKKEELGAVIEKTRISVEAIEEFVLAGLSESMNKFNNISVKI